MTRRLVLLLVAVLVAFTQAPTTQGLGLVAAYNFEEVSGPAIDVSGTGNTGTLTNAVRTAAGKYGQGLSLNGTTAYMKVLDANSIDLAGNGSITLWMYQTAAQNYAGLVHKGELASFSDEAYSLQHETTTRRPDLYLNSTTSSKHILATATTGALSLSAWHHVAVTWDSTGQKLYLDGALNTSLTGAFTAKNSAGALFIGAQYANGFPFKGTLDEVRLYNRALTLAEVQNVMNTPLGGPGPVGDTTPPTATMTAPANGAIVTGTVAVTATASDDSGVAPTVQFLLNGQPVGSPVAGPSPYTLNWNTTSVSNGGGYTLTARATDAAGNPFTTPTGPTVTVSNAPPPPVPVFSDTVAFSGFAQPTFIAFSPQNDIFVGEKASGKIKVMVGGSQAPATLLTLSSFITAPQFFDSYYERGLLGMALDPNYNTNHYIYVYYTICKTPSSPGSATCATNGAANRVARFTVNTVNWTATGHTILIDDIPSPNAYHNAGWVGVSPLDGKLYIAVGDGGGSIPLSPAPDLTSLNGKILRINTDGTIPMDNPIVDGTLAGPVGARGEIWASGFRNPWRCRISPDGRLFCADVGQNTWEEINVVTKAGNYGWPTTEGPFTQATYPQFVHPIYWYDHTVGSSITGGDFGSVTNFPGNYQQSFFYGDYVSGWIKRVVLDGSGVVVAGSAINFLSGVGAVVDIVAGADFNLYYIDINSGTLHRVVLVSGGNRSPIAVAGADVTQGPPTLTVTFSSAGTNDPDGDPLTYAWNFGDGGSSSSPNPTHDYTAPGVYTVTLTVSDGHPGAGIATLTIKVGTPPTAIIDQPADLAVYVAGQSVSLEGHVSDADDPPGTLTPHWKIIFHHDTHTHPFIDDITGATGSFTPSTINEVSSNVWYEVNFSVTDSSGLKTTSIVNVYPQKVNLTFATSPPGLQVAVDGQTLTTPSTMPMVVGSLHTISTLSPQTLGSQSYAYQNWSDLGAQTHSIATPAANTTYTANFTAVVVPPPPSGLVAGYNFEEASGPTVIDVSGTGNTGTLTNAVRTAAGKFGQGLSLNGSTAYMKVLDANSLDLGANGTIALWMNQTAALNYAGLVHKGELTNFSDEAYSLQHETTTRRPDMYLNSTTSSKHVLATATTGVLSLAAWHHVAVTWDSTGLKLYLDGVLNATVAGAFTAKNSAGALFIGAQYANGFPFQGTLDEVSIYNRALTLPEILAAMNTPLVPPPVVPAGDTTPPDVDLLSPLDGAKVSGTVSVTAHASDTGGIAGVQFFQDTTIALGPELPVAASESYSVPWNTAGLTGSHTLTVKARDLFNNVNTDTVTVTTNAPPVQGLMAAYGLDEVFGIAVPDSSGQNNTGTVIGAADPHSIWVPGKFGNAMSFSNAYIAVPDAPSLDLTSAGTVSAWVMATTSLDFKGMVHKGEASNFSDEAYSLQGATNAAALWLTNTGGTQQTNGTSAFPVGSWHHVTATWDASGSKLYIDGVLNKSVAGAFVARNSAGKLIIGAQAPGVLPFIGLIDEVRLYNRALNLTEIQGDMNTPVGSGQLPPPGPLAISAGDVLHDQYFAWENAYTNRQDGNYGWYTITLTAGVSYTFATSNAHGGNSADPYLYLLNSAGAIVASDDNSGGGQLASLTYQPTTSGSYLLKLRAGALNTFGYATLTITSTVSGGGNPKNPDLIVWVDKLRDVRIVTVGTAKKLQFSNGATNVGPGTLDLYGTVQPDGTTFAYQRVWNDNGTFVDYLAGTFSFPGHGGHNHWHFDNFAAYYLRAVNGDGSVGAILRSSDKVSFCVTEGSAYDLTLPGAPQFAVHSCNNQGISIGWADIYTRDVEGQDIDITGIANGTYWLETVVDPNNVLRETDNTNNAGRLKIQINANVVTILP